MKRLVLISALLLAGAPVLRGQSDQTEAGFLDNGIAVIVNDVVITYADVVADVIDERNRLANRYRNEPEVYQQKVRQLERDRIEQLVENQLILHEFQTAGYVLPDSYIDERVQARIKEQFGDRATMTKSLEREGISFETFRKRIRDQFIIQQMRLKNVSSEILISPYKIETYYQTNQNEFKLPERVRLRMIELDKALHGAEATVELAREILTKIKEGVPFAEMARIYSDGPQKDQGGDRDWRDPDFYRKEVSQAAFRLKPGQLSDVINTPDAVYLLQVEQLSPPHVRPLADVRQDIERTLVDAEKNRLTEKWINRLKEKSYIQYF